MFWFNVKQLLSEQQILQKDFAESMGFNIATLKNQMARNISPNVETAVKIAQYLNTSVEFLVTGKEVDGYKTKYDTLVQAIKQLPFD